MITKYMYIFFSGNIISESCGFTLSQLNCNKLKIMKMKNKAFVIVLVSWSVLNLWELL